MLAAWLLATVGAVGVAWVGVHPVADLGLSERPPVPQPEVASSPAYGGGNDSSDPSAPGGITAAPSDTSPSPRPNASRSKLPSPSDSPKPSGPPSASPSGTASPTAPPTSDPYYREASAEGGTATFEYAEDTDGGEVYVVEARSYPGWEISAYRYTKDWVEVQFTSYDHVSTVHAYLDDGYAYLDIYEEDT